MARLKERLTTLHVKNAKSAGYYPDGLGLYLQVAPSGAKSWIFRYMLNSKSREMGLGSLHDLTLANARLKRNEYRVLAREQGIDPITHKRQAKLAHALAEAAIISFDECAAAYIASKSVEWKNPKHHQQWVNTLNQYASPVFGKQPVAAVTTELVMKVLQPIWFTKTETASRLRGRIASVLDWASTSRYRSGENPARWHGHLENLLPSRNKTKPVAHHPALPYIEIGAFMPLLREQVGEAAAALQFLILTCSRTGEVIGATWDEFDLDQRMWTVPASRMKAKREHRVPLTAQALKIINDMKVRKQSDYVFAGRNIERPTSNMAMLKLLERMGRDDLTVHGFRSTFRDWAAHETNFPREIAEAALAHDTRNETEAAYQRGDLFNKRRKLMEAWAVYCERSVLKQVDNVRTIAQRAL